MHKCTILSNTWCVYILRRQTGGKIKLTDAGVIVGGDAIMVTVVVLDVESRLLLEPLYDVSFLHRI